MISLFDKELIRMEKEVRDLKTAHNTPLGLLSFYRKSGTFTWAVDPFQLFIYVRVTIKAGESAEPFLEILHSTPGVEYFTQTITKGWENNGTMWQQIIAFLDFTSRSLNYLITCSSDFDLIFKQYEEGDWIGDLPPEAH